MGRNNRQYQQARLADRTPHYGLRKLSIGVASVLLSTTLYLGATSASADTVTPGAVVTTGATTGDDATATHEAVNESKHSLAGNQQSDAGTATENNQAGSNAQTEIKPSSASAGTENQQAGTGVTTENNPISHKTVTEVDQAGQKAEADGDSVGASLQSESKQIDHGAGTEVNQSKSSTQTEVGQTGQDPDTEVEDTTAMPTEIKPTDHGTGTEIDQPGQVSATAVTVPTMVLATTDTDELTRQTPVTITIKDLDHPDVDDQVITTTVNWSRPDTNHDWSLTAGDQPWQGVDHLTGSIISYQGLQLIYDTTHLVADGQHQVVGTDTSGNLTTLITPGDTTPVKWTVQLGAPTKTVDVKLSFHSTFTDRVTGQPIDYLNDYFQHRTWDAYLTHPDSAYRVTATRQPDGTWQYQMQDPAKSTRTQLLTSQLQGMLKQGHMTVDDAWKQGTWEVTTTLSETGEPQLISIVNQFALQPVSADDIAKQSMLVYYDDDLQQVIGYATPTNDFAFGDGGDNGIKLPADKQNYYYTQDYGVPLTFNPDATKYELVKLTGDAEAVKQAQQMAAEAPDTLMDFGYALDGQPRNRLGS